MPTKVSVQKRIKRAAWRYLQRMLRVVETVAASGGLAELIRRRDRGVRILLYHHIGEEEGMVRPAAFQRHMEYLKHAYHPISLDQLAACLRGQGELPARAVVVTFDDGYGDTFKNAYPILREVGVPATVFLTTGFVGVATLHRTDRLRRLQQQRVRIPEPVAKAFPAAARNNLLFLERVVDNRTCDRIINEMERELGISVSDDGMNNLSWDEIREMATQGVSIGSHTITHPRLAELYGVELLKEILGSKQTIEECVGVPCRHFSYPYGKSTDLSPESVQVVREAGFETACTALPGVNGAGTDPYLLRRISIPDQWETAARFALGICGVDMEASLDCWIQAVRRGGVNGRGHRSRGDAPRRKDH